MIVFLFAVLIIAGLIGRLVYLMVFEAPYYQEQAEELHERERDIKAARGEILDVNGTVLATNRTVCTISVIHSQITDSERVIRELSRLLELDEGGVRKRWKRYPLWSGSRQMWIKKSGIRSVLWGLTE